MNIQRITVSLPEYVHQQLITFLPPRKRSQFVARIIEKEIVKMKTIRNPIDDFFDFYKKNKIPKLTRADILKAIRKGRLKSFN